LPQQLREKPEEEFGSWLPIAFFHFEEEGVDAVSFMGMGEPLLNDNLFPALGVGDQAPFSRFVFSGYLRVS
jgi:adenine C2-methylase RlmN of 23S rRNA A2503 and tRNA A37